MALTDQLAAAFAAIAADVKALKLSATDSTYPAPSGVYQGPSNVLVSASSAVTNGNCSWVPFDVGPTARTFDRIGVNVGTAAAGGTTPVLRLGIYANGDGKPGALLLDAGAVTITATGIQAITISQTLQPGRYWLAAAYTYAVAPTTALQVFQVTNAAPALPGPTYTNNYRCYLLSGVAAGSLPAIGAAAPSVTGGVTVGLRRA